MNNTSIEELEFMVNTNSVQYAVGKNLFRNLSIPLTDSNCIDLKKLVELEVGTYDSKGLDQFHEECNNDEFNDVFGKCINNHRFGFIDSLVDFMVEKDIRYCVDISLDFYEGNEKNISKKSFIIYNKEKLNVKDIKEQVVETLLNEYGLEGYIKGFQMQSCEIIQDEDPVKAFNNNARLMSGYELGFMVRVAKEFGETISQTQVPDPKTIDYFLEVFGNKKIAYNEGLSNLRKGSFSYEIFKKANNLAVILRTYNKSLKN
jgi:hypothetical protein